MENNEAKYYTVMCLLALYTYGCFKSIPLPVNSSKGVFGYNQYCVDFRLVIFFFPLSVIYPEKMIQIVYFSFPVPCVIKYLTNYIFYMEQEACF